MNDNEWKVGFLAGVVASIAMTILGCVVYKLIGL